MFSQDDIDAVLREAEDAVSELAGDVGLSEKSEKQAAPPPPEKKPQPKPATFSTAVLERPASKARVKRILSLRVPLIVRLASRSMAVSEIMKMSPGTILEFDRTVEQELDLMINNCIIGAGVAVKVNEHFGLRITRINDVKSRIGSLGSAKRSK